MRDIELYKAIRSYILKEVTKKNQLTPEMLARLLKELRKIS